MIATIDPSNSVILYTGVTCIGKVNIPGVVPTLSGCNYYVSNVHNKLSSPFPRRSSLLATSSMQDLKYEEGLHLFSPVGNPAGRSSVLLESTELDSNLFTIKDAVGNKVTFERGNKKYFRITLPLSSTSPLGKRFFLSSDIFSI